MFVLKIHMMDEVEILEFANLIQAIDYAQGNASTYDCSIIETGQLGWYIRNGELFASIPGPINYTIERKK